MFFGIEFVVVEIDDYVIGFVVVVYVCVVVVFFFGVVEIVFEVVWFDEFGWQVVG